jgi:AraC family transcriptional regulator
MSVTPPQTLDLNGEYIQHVPLLASEGWDGLTFVYEREPAGEMPAAQLDRHALIVSLGNCRANYWLDGRWQSAEYTAGDLVWMPAAELFPKVQIDRAVPLLQLAIDPQIIDRIAGSSSAQIDTAVKFRDPLIYQIAVSLQQELAASGTDSKLYADSMTIALATHLWQRYGHTSTPKISGGLSTKHVAAVRDYIQANLDAPLSLAELAALVQLHPHYFASLFKQSLGISPYRYILQQRIDRSQTYLARSEYSIVEICQLVGFQNQSHFTRVFRQHTGVTPKVYRSQIEGRG